MITLPADYLRDTQRGRDTSAWLWFFRLVADVTETATTVLYLVRAREEITLDGDTYYPFPIEIGDFGTNARGDIPGFTVTASNRTRLLPKYLEMGKGFRGMPATVKLAKKAHLASGPALSIDAVVRSASLEREGVALRCEVANPQRVQVPQRRYSNDICDYAYGDSRCGVKLDAAMAALFPTCPKTQAACDERGGAEASLGRPKLHPRRFGGQPGINPRLRR